jgi:succinate dehydrogenase hydrophobic anchor subunit
MFILFAFWNKTKSLFLVASEVHGIFGCRYFRKTWNLRLSLLPKYTKSSVLVHSELYRLKISHLNFYNITNNYAVLTCYAFARARNLLFLVASEVHGIFGCRCFRKTWTWNLRLSLLPKYTKSSVLVHSELYRLKISHLNFYNKTFRNYTD